MSDKSRDLVYKVGIVLFIAAMGVAVAFGIIADAQADALIATITALVASVTGVGVSGLAKKNIRPATTQAVVTVQDVIDALRADDGEPGKHRAEPATRADTVRARYGADSE